MIDFIYFFLVICFKFFLFNTLHYLAAQLVWNGIKASVCYFHVLKTFKDTLTKVDTKIKNEICTDISILQGAQSEIEYQAGIVFS